MTNKIKDMFVLQDKANSLISGKQWKDGHNAVGQEIDWNRATMMEITELIDSFQYKWWKANKTNELYSILNNDNIYIEIVDIWHFLMSEILRISKDNDSLFETFVDVVESELLPSRPKVQSNKEFIQLVETLLLRLMKYKIAVDNSNKDFDGLVNLLKQVTELFVIIALQRMTFDVFYNKYILKNVLNIFRLEHGYQDGTYSKTWLGREDNEYLSDYVKAGNEINLNSINQYLTDMYTEATKGN